MLASASDDRSVRLWRAGPGAAAEAAAEAAIPAGAAGTGSGGGGGRSELLQVLLGHSARLWDVDVDVGSGVVATGSEDRSVRCGADAQRLSRDTRSASRARQE